MSERIAFVGGGNMASALIGGLIGNGFPAASIAVAEIDGEGRERLARTFGIEVSARLADVAGEVDTVLLAVKPQHMLEVARSLRPLLARQLVVSIAAGIQTADLARWLGGYARVVRVMPNTPALVRAGVSGLFARPEVSPDERTRAEAILRAVGDVIWVEREALIDSVTAVSGSGPAYVFYFIEAMCKAAVATGLEPHDARRLVMGTFAGAVRLAQSSDEDVAVLRSRVTSKGGTTERALTVMATRQVDAGIALGVHAAFERSAELGAELGKAG